jgi:hypothetical protein
VVFLEGVGLGRTAFCANPARRRNAFVTSTELIFPSAICAARSSTVLSVILISSGERTSFARGIVFSGTFLMSGRPGSRAAIVSSRCFCLSAATSCHVAPEAMVTFAAIVSGSSQSVGRACYGIEDGLKRMHSCYIQEGNNCSVKN